MKLRRNKRSSLNRMKRRMESSGLYLFEAVMMTGNLSLAAVAIIWIALQSPVM